LIESVSPIQYAIRLLIPTGSKLLDLEEVRNLVGPFSEEALSYPWAHRDPMVDELHKKILAGVEAAQASKASRREIFAKVWRLATSALECSTMQKLGVADGAGRDGKDGMSDNLAALTERKEAPHLSENWYC